jgi:hypothetical protein
MRTRLPLLAATALLVAGCGGSPPQAVARQSGPPERVSGLCYAKGVTPAVFETVTEHVIEAPEMRAPDGTLLSPARFRTVTATRLVSAREVSWFETPCALERREAGFVAQVQRALAVRGLYDGPAHGAYDQATRRAVEAFQAPRGIESGILSTEAAQALGLVALGREVAGR